MDYSNTQIYEPFVLKKKNRNFPFLFNASSIALTNPFLYLTPKLKDPP